MKRSKKGFVGFGVTICLGALLLFHALPATAMNFGLREAILKGRAIDDTQWTVLDLSRHKLYQRGARALYMELKLDTLTGECSYNDTAYFLLRPRGQDIDRRTVAVNFTESPGKEDSHSFHFWIPLTENNRFEYRVLKLDKDCGSELEYELLVRGYN
jgi:hypothetical protein